jgi:hypothetical protein
MGRMKLMPSPALVIATLALVLGLGGGAFALSKNGDNRKDRRIANRAIHRAAPNLSVKHAVSADTATNADHATSADSATTAASATTATDADHATSANTATTATTASNAQQLGGVNPMVPATPMTLLNGWARYGGAGYDTPAYWEDAFGVVHLKGSVAQSPAGSDVIFTLPPGLRPSQSMNWPATLDSAHFGTIEIETNGDVRSRTFNATQATQAQTFTSMEGVEFRPTDP